MSSCPGLWTNGQKRSPKSFRRSCLMGTGQFCTNPGLVLLLAGPATDKFIADLAGSFGAAPVGMLLSSSVAQKLRAERPRVDRCGGGNPRRRNSGSDRRLSVCEYVVTCVRSEVRSSSGKAANRGFGNASLIVVAKDAAEAAAVLDHLEGNLTGCIYSDTRGSDDALYEPLAERLRPRVGRLLNDKMPTGVAVSPAMNHGGPYPRPVIPDLRPWGFRRRCGVLPCSPAMTMCGLPGCQGCCKTKA